MDIWTFLNLTAAILCGFRLLHFASSGDFNTDFFVNLFFFGLNVLIVAYRVANEDD